MGFTLDIFGGAGMWRLKFESGQTDLKEDAFRHDYRKWEERGPDPREFIVECILVRANFIRRAFEVQVVRDRSTGPRFESGLPIRSNLFNGGVGRRGCRLHQHH